MYGNGKTMCAMTNNEQLAKLIQAAEQMADDDPRLTQTRALIRLLVLAKLRETYPDLDLTNCADVMATVFKNLANLVQWEDDKGVRLANDQPAIRDALLSEIRMLLFANLNQSPTRAIH
jgi:hypothetical protein